MSRRKRNLKVITVISSVLVAVLVVGVGFYLFSEERSLLPDDVTGATEKAPEIAIDGDILYILPESETYSGFFIFANDKYVAATSELTVDLSEVFKDHKCGSYSIKVQDYNSTGETSDYSNVVVYKKIAPVTAPVISLDGDNLRIEYDFTVTRYLLTEINGKWGWELPQNENGIMLLNIKEWFRGCEAGEYSVTIQAYGYDDLLVTSNAVTYVYDGSLEAPGTHLMGFGVYGADGIEVSYVLGRSDLSDLVNNWDSAEPVASTIPGLSFHDLYEDSYLMIYLPEGVTVKSCVCCEFKTYDDPRFVQFYNFTDDGIAVCNFEVAGESESTDPSEPATPTAPVISIDGDVLTVCYDANTKYFSLFHNEENFGYAFMTDDSGCFTINVKNYFAGEEAGEYTITAEAHGYDVSLETATSNAVTYVYDGSVEAPGDCFLSLAVSGTDSIEVSYVIGRSDLSELVNNWDNVESVVNTMNPWINFTYLHEDTYLMLYLPEGVKLKSYVRCEVQTYDDPRFIQIYNLDKDGGIAVCNFEFTEPIGDVTLSLEETTLVIEQSGGIPTEYCLIWARSFSGGYNHKADITPTGSTTRVDLTPYLEVGGNFFKVMVYDGDDFLFWTNPVSYMLLSGLTEPTISLDGGVLKITPGEGVATSYEILRSEDGVTYSTAATVDANGDEVVTVDITEYAIYETTYFKVRAVNKNSGERDETADPVAYVAEVPDPLTEPTISLDGSILKITPGEGVATSYEILRSEDGVTYSTAATVDANGDEAVTVDITEYAIYETTYFKVRAVNTDTGESVETKAAVTYAPDHSGVYTLSVIGGGTGVQNQFYYAVNMSTEDFGGGEYDGIINGEGVIEGLSYGDVVFIRPYSWTSTIEVLDADDTFTYTIEYDNFLVVATNIEGDGSITLKNILA